MSIHRATVVSDDDPLAEGRLQVSIVSSGSVAWARTVIPIAAFSPYSVPVGTGVWIAFESDDPDLPIVLGSIEPLPRAASLARDLEGLGDAWDLGHAAGIEDATGGETPNPYR